MQRRKGTTDRARTEYMKVEMRLDCGRISLMAFHAPSA